jgi:hypothetical protein
VLPSYPGAGELAGIADGMYSFSDLPPLNTSFWARLNTRNPKAATVHTPPEVSARSFWTDRLVEPPTDNSN